MSEELKQQETTEQTPIQQQTEEKQFSEVEQEALAQGWVPKEEFEGDANKWVDAGEFVRRGELFKKIEHQNREIKEVRKALAAFKDHYTKVSESSYQKALKDLKQQYKLANREGDFEKADQLEAEIESVEQEAKQVISQAKEVAQEAQIHPEFAAWVQKNDWYATQPHMKTFADHKGLEFAKLGLSPSEVLKKVELEVKKEFPTKFRNPNQDRPGAVESPGTTRATTRQSSKEDYSLTPQEEAVMKTLLSERDKNGKPLITKEQYIADLKAIKARK